MSVRGGKKQTRGGGCDKHDQDGNREGLEAAHVKGAALLGGMRDSGIGGVLGGGGARESNATAVLMQQIDLPSGTAHLAALNSHCIYRNQNRLHRKTAAMQHWQQEGVLSFAHLLVLLLPVVIAVGCSL